MQYQVLNNQKVGKYLAWYENGNLKQEGKFAKGKADSLWLFYFENGKKKSIVNYQSGKIEGKSVWFYENGRTESEGLFKDGKKDGNWNYYYQNGSLKISGSFANDKKEGIWKSFDEQKRLLSICEYHQGVGFFKELYADSHLKSRGKMKGNLADSTWEYYDSQGYLSAKGNFANGIKTGTWSFYKSGQLLSEGNYTNGKENGTWKFYNEQGKLLESGEMVQGEKVGTWKHFRPDGSSDGQSDFSENGSLALYYPDGKPKQLGSMKNGKPIGQWKEFYEDGSLKSLTEFIDIQTKYTAYHINGKIAQKGNLENGKRVGTWQIFDENGELIGSYKEYNSTDTPIVEPKPIQDTTRPVVIQRVYIPAQMVLVKKGSRYFTKVINEEKGFIVSLNPLGVLFGALPFGLEYHIKDRLGYQFVGILIRSPFFTPTLKNSNELYKEGFSGVFRQKLYNKDNGNGSFYWAQEVRYTNTKFYFNREDYVKQLVTPFRATEEKFEVSILTGFRFFYHPLPKLNFSIDLFGGLGVGYRKHNLPAKSVAFTDENRDKITIPLRLNGSVGIFF